MPECYRRAVVTRFGGPEVVRLETAALPSPAAGEVRLRVLAAGVSFADLLIREGIHPEAWFDRPPFTLGWDVVGVVDAVGAGVQGWSTGQRAAALPIKGGCAEAICLPASELVAVPDGLDAAEAVCMAFNYATAYQMLHRSARVVSGERVLIHSASGGIGSALVQLGALAGLEMFGTASTAKHAHVREMGSTPIDYRSTDFVTEALRLTGGRGVDVVFDGIGGANLRRSYRALRPGGRVIAYGLTAALGYRQALPLTIGRSLGEWLIAFLPNLIPGGRRVRLYSIQTLKRVHPDWYREDVTTLLRLLGDGRIRPLIAGRYPLEEIVRTHERMAAGAFSGKIVLEMATHSSSA
ncbi:MAG: zinc-binding dehydrogenase [Chloroflexi bacterium]|nr:zinc-binding dehydrogenase [Chloroflexota bacterium]